MKDIKPFTKAWFKGIVAGAEQTKAENPALTLQSLLNDLELYIQHLDEVDSRRGAPGKASEKKIAANRINAKKGGWKKGVPRNIKHYPSPWEIIND